jgi:hypothetical protein
MPQFYAESCAHLDASGQGRAHRGKSLLSRSGLGSGVCRSAGCIGCSYEESFLHRLYEDPGQSFIEDKLKSRVLQTL